MCALIQTRVTPSVSTPGFSSVRILPRPFWTFPWRFLLLFHPNSVGRVEHQEQLGWSSGVAAFGFCVFLAQKPEHGDIMTIPRFLFTPLTLTKRRSCPFYSHFLSCSGVSIAFYWAEEPRRWKSERSLSSLFSKSTPARLKSNFYPWQLSRSSVLHWKILGVLGITNIPGQEPSFPWLGSDKSCQCILSLMWWFFFSPVLSDIIQTSCSKDSILDFNRCSGVKMGILT